MSQFLSNSELCAPPKEVEREKARSFRVGRFEDGEYYLVSVVKVVDTSLPVPMEKPVWTADEPSDAEVAEAVGNFVNPLFREGLVLMKSKC